MTPLHEPVPIVAMADATYVFKIRTKDGGIVGNIAIRDRSKEAAEVKLRKRYPDCTILDCQTKD